ncbi:hypothetical protein QJU96_03130 [Pasteurella skyensis]|uniref:hypothetical protein n=1 Tax=Phocoenobacter skyensis TaxID=97481 RepID=UPI0027938F37|nr:hypothetical protein [Pasteurella skyensis]MDP8170284.1 hypothetical protein [Pasteurella skyensis]
MKKQAEKWATKKGRPVKLNIDLATELLNKEIDYYLVTQDDEDKYFAIINTGASVVVKAKSFTTLSDIALTLGTTRKTLIDNATAKDKQGRLKNEALYDAYMRFKDVCEAQLIRGGLSGAYNSNMVTFLCNVNHGMIPRKEVEQTVQVKSMDSVYKELDEIYNQEQERLAKQEQAMKERQMLLG